MPQVLLKGLIPTAQLTFSLHASPPLPLPPYHQVLPQTQHIVELPEEYDIPEVLPDDPGAGQAAEMFRAMDLNQDGRVRAHFKFVFEPCSLPVVAVDGEAG